MGGINFHAMRAADILRRLGVQPGDLVGVFLPKCTGYIIALNGIWRALSAAGQVWGWPQWGFESSNHVNEGKR